MNSKSTELKNFLSDRFVGGAAHNNVSLINPVGKLYFDRDSEEEFWEIYSRLLMEQGSEFVVGIAQKPEFVVPVVVDIDIKIEEDEDDVSDFGDHLYSNAQVRFIIQTYQSVIRSVMEDCKEDNLICILLEKDIYRFTKNNITWLKNGFHLHFPNCFVEIPDLQTQIVPRVKQILKDSKTFENLGFEDSSEVLDDVCGRVPWLLYGSRKPDLKPYVMTKIFDSSCNEISLKDTLTKCSIKDTNGDVILLNKEYEYYIPRLLTINPFNKDKLDLKTGIISPVKENIRNKKRKEFKEISTEKQVAMATELLPMLSVTRACNRNEWMTIGWILHNISDGSEEGLDLWLEFSERDPGSYNEDTCIYEWERMVKKDMGIGTLRYYAGQDDPMAYKEFVKKNSKKYVNQSLDGSHNSIAKLLFEYFGDRYKCGSMVGCGVWYEFRNHIWVEIEEAVTLRKKLSNEVVKIYEARLKEIEKEFEGADKGGEQALKTYKKQYEKVIKNLCSAPFKNNIIKEAKEEFYEEKFKDKLNSNPWIIAFNNGVYDLKNNHFRIGRPDDFMSKKMTIDYIEFKEGDDKVMSVHDFFEKVFPDASVRKYFLDVVCETFVGGNFKKIGLLWTGEGDNAKSVTQYFFEKMFGAYAVKLNTAVLTRPKAGGGSANADMARTGDGVRWVVAEEPDKDEVINNGIYKNITGLDSYFARDLFEKGKSVREINPMYLLTIICNKLPRFKDYDIATFNRTRVIPFESTFCRPTDPAPECPDEQLRQKRFPMDPNFTSKIPDLLPAFAWVLLTHRKNKTGILITPHKVLAATKSYEIQNDIYRQFIEENVREDKNSNISTVEVYELFKNWYRESFPSHSVPVKNDAKDYFSKLWGDQKRGRWYGYKIYREEFELDTEIVESAETSGAPM
jgi:P4 family phage/plasmid primase-like protien